MARKGQTEPNYADTGGPSGAGRRWLAVSFNLFYPALISVLVLLVLSRFVHLPLGEELSASMDRMLGGIQRSVQSAVESLL